MTTATAERKEQRAERTRQRIAGVYQAVEAELRKQLGPDRKLVVGADSGSFSNHPNFRIDGTLVPMVVTEDRPGGYYTSGNGNLRAKVGDYGDVTQYPEGKNGINIEKVVASMIQHAAVMQRRKLENEASQARMAQGYRLAEALRAVAASAANAVEISSRGATATIKVDVTDEAQGRAIIEAIHLVLKGEV